MSTEPLQQEIAGIAAGQHLENFKLYAAKAKEWGRAGRDDMAALFRTAALHSGRQWLALLGAAAASVEVST